MHETQISPNAFIRGRHFLENFDANSNVDVILQHLLSDTTAEEAKAFFAENIVKEEQVEIPASEPEEEDMWGSME